MNYRCGHKKSEIDLREPGGKHTGAGRSDCGLPGATQGWVKLKHGDHLPACRDYDLVSKDCRPKDWTAIDEVDDGVWSLRHENGNGVGHEGSMGCSRPIDR